MHISYFSTITAIRNMFGISRIVNKIPTTRAEVYLTFDDGPNNELTPRVLDLLLEREVKASFFVVGRDAHKNLPLLRRIIEEGHAVYSHSLDHNTVTYLRSPFFIRRWLRDSLAELEDLTGQPQRLFRPPVGIIPPPLLWAAWSLDVKLVLWNHRFYDTVYEWKSKSAERSLQRIASGDIVLLHDRQRPPFRDQFLLTLGEYLSGLKRLALQPVPIPANLE